MCSTPNQPIERAYPAAETFTDPTVELNLEIAAAAVSVVVVDRGRWKDPHSEPSDRGRGITIMRSLADSFEIRRDGTGTTATMRYLLPA